MDPKQTLLNFFRISTTLFHLQDNIRMMAKGVKQYSEMQYLHELALKELEKDQSDIDFVHSLIDKMELLASNSPKPNFEKGSIIHEN